MSNKINARADAQNEFRWFLSENGERVVIQSHHANAWVPAAEVSVPEAKMTKMMACWRNSPLLFDILEELCGELAAEKAA